jgi:hypothetical protein
LSILVLIARRYAVHRYTDYRPTTVKPLASRPEDEKQAICEYCEGAHPTNVPASIDDGRWSFAKSKKTGRLIAALE